MMLSCRHWYVCERNTFMFCFSSAISPAHQQLVVCPHITRRRVHRHIRLPAPLRYLSCIPHHRLTRVHFSATQRVNISMLLWHLLAGLTLL
jgi:hypothetical protein